MEPRIQYVQTTDGVSIAYWVLGEGPPLVHLTLVLGHIQMEWQLPECRRWYERLAESRKLIRFDFRGGGLSDRNVGDFSLEGLLLDLEAVADRLGLETFALFGPAHFGPVAIAYAARHPERVSHLLLWSTYREASDWSSWPQVQGIRALMNMDWNLYTEALAHMLLGWSEGEPARRFAALVRESITQEDLQRVLPAISDWDTRPLLPHVKAPTLVLQRREAIPGVTAATGLASRIPGARLALLEGESLAPYLGDSEAVLTAVNEFLGEAEPAAASTARAPAGGLVNILFTDMEGSTTLTQRLGDAGAQDVLDAHNAVVREALTAHGGSEIKHTGDGIMASFPLTSSALECAIAIQRALARHNESSPQFPIRVRIGLNAGEPVTQGQDLFGTAVQLARRICDHAQPGQVLASDVVRQLAAGKDFLFADTGAVALKGFEDPVRLYETRWLEEDA